MPKNDYSFVKFPYEEAFLGATEEKKERVPSEKELRQVQTIPREELEGAALLIVTTRHYVDTSTDERIRTMLEDLGFHGEVLYVPPEGRIETISRARVEELIREVTQGLCKKEG